MKKHQTIVPVDSQSGRNIEHPEERKSSNIDYFKLLSPDFIPYADYSLEHCSMMHSSFDFRCVRNARKSDGSVELARTNPDYELCFYFSEKYFSVGLICGTRWFKVIHYIAGSIWVDDHTNVIKNFDTVQNLRFPPFASDILSEFVTGTYKLKSLILDRWKRIQEVIFQFYTSLPTAVFSLIREYGNCDVFLHAQLFGDFLQSYNSLINGRKSGIRELSRALNKPPQHYNSDYLLQQPILNNLRKAVQVLVDPENDCLESGKTSPIVSPK